LHPTRQLIERGVGATGPLPVQQHVVDNQAERVDVRTVVGGFSSCLLRRHVLNRADHSAHHRLISSPGVLAEGGGDVGQHRRAAG